MEDYGSVTEGPRTWQETAKARGFSLRTLGEKVGRTHSTMLAYSCGKRPIPQPVRERMAEVLGSRCL